MRIEHILEKNSERMYNAVDEYLVGLSKYSLFWNFERRTIDFDDGLLVARNTHKKRVVCLAFYGIIPSIITAESPKKFAQHNYSAFEYGSGNFPYKVKKIQRGLAKEEYDENPLVCLYLIESQLPGVGTNLVEKLKEATMASNHQGIVTEVVAEQFFKKQGFKSLDYWEIEVFVYWKNPGYIKEK